MEYVNNSAEMWAVLHVQLTAAEIVQNIGICDDIVMK